MKLVPLLFFVAGAAAMAVSNATAQTPATASVTIPGSKVRFAEDWGAPRNENQRKQAIAMLPRVSKAVLAMSQGHTVQAWCKNVQAELTFSRIGFCDEGVLRASIARPFIVKNLRLTGANISVLADEETATAPALYTYQITYAYDIVTRGKYPEVGTRSVEDTYATVSIRLPSGNLTAQHPADIPFIATQSKDQF